MNTAELRVAAYRGLKTFYALTRTFRFYDHRKRCIVVKRGFITDGASFPWWLRFVPSVLMFALIAAGEDALSALVWATAAQAFVGYPVHSAYADAAVAHDYLYSIGAGKLYADCVLFVLIVRRARVLHARYVGRHPLAYPLAIPILGYRIARAAVMFLAVSLLGWFAYWGHAYRRAAE